MADYFGVVAIAKRMGVHPATIKQWQDRKGFLIYHRWNSKTRRYVWYTNDNLIHAWELARCSQERRTPQPADERPTRGLV